MLKRFCVLTAAVMLATASLSAQNSRSTTNQGATPNGKPFQQLQNQVDALQQEITALQQQLAALDARVTTIASDLQSQLNDINTRLTTLETNVASLDASVATLENATALLTARVTANEDAIAALQAANAAFTTALNDVRTQLTTAEGTLRTELQNVESSLRTLIDNNTQTLNSLQQQTDSMQQFLNNMANMDCSAGQAVRGISPTGILVCSSVGGNLTSTTYSGWFYASPGSSGYANFSCPAGQTLAGGGFDHWPVQNYTTYYDADRINYPYLNSAWYSYWNGYYYDGYYYFWLTHNVYDYSSARYVPFTASTITRSLSSYNTYSVAAQNRGGLYYYTAYVNWTATCLSAQ